MHGDAALVRGLAQAGAFIDHASRIGTVCLMYVVSARRTAVPRALPELGADAAPRTRDDFSAPDMAANPDCPRPLQQIRPNPASL